MNIIRKSGVTPVVCLNRFYTDTDLELALVRRICEEYGVRCAVSDHWRYGGAGQRSWRGLCWRRVRSRRS